MAQAPTANIPPQNIEAEESVLGAMGDLHDVL
jgi:replicative DNA helicase